MLCSAYTSTHNTRNSRVGWRVGPESLAMPSPPLRRDAHQAVTSGISDGSSSTLLAAARVGNHNTALKMDSLRPPGAASGPDPMVTVLDWPGHYDLSGDLSGATAQAFAGNSQTVDWDEVPVADGLCNDEEASSHRETVRATPRQQGHTLRDRLLQHKNADAGNHRSFSPTKVGCRDASSSCSRLARANEKRSNRDIFEVEEEEWDQRQQKSGTVGRLVVYREGESPRDDIVLRGGGRRHIVVAGVREGGQAARVGARAGDRLVSINGRKDFLGLPVDVVRDRLQAPTVLVFLGFVGKLQAEVRLTATDHVCCGIPTRREAVRGSDTAPLRLCQEQIFDAGVASLFLVSGPPEEVAKGGNGAASDKKLPMFELQQFEAQRLVKRALQRREALQLLARETAAIEAASEFEQPTATVANPLVPPLNFDKSALVHQMV